jgi:hypothetical protein
MMVSLSKIDMENKSAIDGCILPDTRANLTVNYGLSKWTKVKTQDNCDNSSGENGCGGILSRLSVSGEE